MKTEQELDIEKLIKEYIKDNLVIRIDKKEESDYSTNTTYIKIKLELDGEIISEDSVDITSY